MNMRQIHIFFKFSKAIRQFVWLFMCFVRVANMVAKPKIVQKKIIKNPKKVNKNNFTFTTLFATLTKRRTRKSPFHHCRTLEIHEENIDLSCIYLAVHNKYLLFTFSILCWMVRITTRIMMPPNDTSPRTRSPYQSTSLTILSCT